MKPAMGKIRHGKPFLEYRCKPDKAGGRCPAPAAVKANVIEPFVVERLFEFAEGATAPERVEEERRRRAGPGAHRRPKRS